MQVSCNKYGCRIMQRLIENAVFDPLLQSIIDELLLQSFSLCRSKYGNYVASCILEHCCAKRDQFHSLIAGANMKSFVYDYCCHEHASHVVQNAL
eukprot:12401808-Karenia_brevis.AAC.1